MKQTLYTFIVCAVPAMSLADTPVASYIFPAGGQRGTTVQFRVGGLYLHEGCPFEMFGPGVKASNRIERTKTVWFEGPVIPIPDSQRQEDYPKDYAGSVTLSAEAPLGLRAWRVWTSQGAVAARPFIVGDLPEIIENETDGTPIPVEVKLPLTINGRIFPREDVDIWSFDVAAGQAITCTVLAGKFGSPLEPRVEIVDPQGRRVAESVETSHVDAFVRFTASATGTYQARIHDINFGGLQPYVYRLTITAGPFVDHVYPLGGRRGSKTRFEVAGQSLLQSHWEIALPAEGSERFTQAFKVGEETSNVFSLELSDAPETLEAEPNDEISRAQPVAIPAVLNGRIDRPGDADLWAFQAVKNDVLEFDVRAARLGSPLDSVLVVLDAAGKELARADDISNTQSDSQLRFKVPADGLFYIRVEERLTSRGGPAFAYRLHAVKSVPDFRLEVTPEKPKLPGADAVTLYRGGQAKFGVEVERLGGFEGEIHLSIAGLPADVTPPTVAKMEGVQAVIPAKQPRGQLTLKAAADAKIQSVPITITGTAMIDGKPVTRTATVKIVGGEIQFDSVQLVVAMPTPFKVKGEFETKYAHRGSVFTRHYTIERGGFDGPITVELADKQNRHLQGVAGPVIMVPANATEFDYPVTLPPWMEVGRTSRSVVALIGEIAEGDGVKHKVSATSDAQSDQIIVLVDPERLGLDLERKSLAVVPGGTAIISFRITRGTGVTGPVIVELVTPAHIRGVEAAPVTVPPDQSAATLTLRFARDSFGPFNAPLTLRATVTKDGKPIVAEAKFEAVVAD